MMGVAGRLCISIEGFCWIYYIYWTTMYVLKAYCLILLYMLEDYAQVQEASADLPYRLDSYSCIEGLLLDITGYARRLCISIEGTLLDLLYRLDSYSPTAKTLVVYTQQHQWHSIELVYLTWIQMDIGQTPRSREEERTTITR